MKRLKHIISVLISILGDLLAIYTGGYVLFIRPLFRIYDAFRTSTLTFPMLLKYLIMIFFAATIAGGIWCVFDILAGMFRERSD